MNVNKKLDRLKQWAGERMGGEAKTNVSDDFKALEVEMALRHEGAFRDQFPHSCCDSQIFGRPPDVPQVWSGSTSP